MFFFLRVQTKCWPEKKSSTKRISNAHTHKHYRAGRDNRQMMIERERVGKGMGGRVSPATDLNDVQCAAAAATKNN